MRAFVRLLPVIVAAAVAASCGSDTPTSPDLKQSAVSTKTKRDSITGDSIRLAANAAAPLSARAAKRAAAVSTVCARQRRMLVKAQAQLARNPSSQLLKSKARSVTAAVGDACS